MGSFNSYNHSRRLLQWRHIERDSVSNHRRLAWLFSRLSRVTSMKTSKPALLALVEGNPWETGGFPWRRAIKECWNRFHLMMPSCTRYKMLKLEPLSFTSLRSNACWRHQMETFSELITLSVVKPYGLPVNFPHKGPVMRTLMIFGVVPHKLWNKQSNDGCLETTWRSCEVNLMDSRHLMC